MVDMYLILLYFSNMITWEKLAQFSTFTPQEKASFGGNVEIKESISPYPMISVQSELEEGLCN